MSGPLPDGTTLLSSLVDRLRDSPDRNLNGCYLGTVIGIRYSNEADSRSRITTEYDVWLHAFRRKVSNVMRIDRAPGPYNGSEETLAKENEAFVDPVTGEVLQSARTGSVGNNVRVTLGTPGMVSFPRGDRVIVQFVDGSYLNPVIVGVYPQNDTPLKGTSANTPRSVHNFNNTETQIDKGGNVVIVFQDGPGQGLPNDNKSLTLKWGATDFVKIEKAGGDVKVTFGDGANSAAIFEAMNSWWSGALVPGSGGPKTVFDSHVHTSAAAGSPTSTPMIFPAVPVVFAGFPPTAQSTKTKLPTE